MTGVINAGATGCRTVPTGARFFMGARERTRQGCLVFVSAYLSSRDER